ncbi:MAG: ribonuclease J [Dehalococcoidia bacterium]|nr:ribonuclease J [Dehalococcoidia bacterium]MDW8120079.1 ribonuclease J [Chloroflexota bacterium]
MTTTLRVIPLGGLGEIGKNMLALEVGEDIVVIDAGVMFPEEDMLGVDLVIPDISYLLQRKEKVRGILITHGHEDHTGALPYVLNRLPVPVYAVGLAHGLIGIKLKEHHLSPKVPLHKVEPLRPVHLGRLTAEFFPVCHSIPDAMGIVLETPLGLVFHTGDFKIDHTPVHGAPTDFSVLAGYARRGIFLMLADSTYAEVPGYTPSERVLTENLDHIIGEAPGRVMVATFASLISRVQQVLDAAAKHKRKVAVVGRSMAETVQLALKMGYLKPKPGVLQPWSTIRTLPPEQVVIVTTGTQGEPTSALVRIANRDHREIEVLPGDTIVMSASPIPGNETVISRTIDNLCRQGARVLYHRNALVHVHGHAAQEELKLMLRLMRPRYFVPVHGEYRHLVAHAQLAKSMGVAPENVFVLENGDVLELTADGGQKVERIPCGHIYVDGLRLWEPESVVLRDRHLLSRDGVVVAVLTVDRTTGRLVRPPDLTSSGFVDPQEASVVLGRAAQALQEALDSRRAIPAEWGYLSAKAKEILEEFLYHETRRRPMVLPVTITV